MAGAYFYCGTNQTAQRVEPFDVSYFRMPAPGARRISPFNITPSAATARLPREKTANIRANTLI